MADKLLELERRLDTPRERPLDKATARLVELASPIMDRPQEATMYRKTERTGDRLYAALEIERPTQAAPAETRPPLERPDRIPTELERNHNPGLRPMPEMIRSGMGGMFDTGRTFRAHTAQREAVAPAPEPQRDEPTPAKAEAERNPFATVKQWGSPEQRHIWERPTDRLATVMHQADVTREAARIEREVTARTSPIATREEIAAVFPAMRPAPRRDLDRDR